MRLHWLGQWGMIYFEWPQRYSGYALLGVYLAFFLVLFYRVIHGYRQRRDEFRGTWLRRFLWLLGGVVFGILLANTFELEWPARSLTREFGQNREIVSATDVMPFDGLHKLSATFPEDGEYVVELTMDVEGQEEVIGFRMLAGNPSATPSVLIAIGGGLAVFLITVRAIKKKRERRNRLAGSEELATDVQHSGAGSANPVVEATG